MFRVHSMRRGIGRATFDFISPPLNSPVPGKIAPVGATPVGNDFDNANTRTVAIALTPVEFYGAESVVHRQPREPAGIGRRRSTRARRPMKACPVAIRAPISGTSATANRLRHHREYEVHGRAHMTFDF